MNEKIILSETKVLEHNERAFSDTMQLFSFLDKDKILKEKEFLSNPENQKSIQDLYFDKGRTIWLKLVVEDTFLSGLIMSWMYTRSKLAEQGNGLQVFGCSLQEIRYFKPGYSEQEREAIKMLYKSVFEGNDDKTGSL